MQKERGTMRDKVSPFWLNTTSLTTGTFYWDTETRGRLKLAVKHGGCGSERYLRDEHTQIRLILWAVDDGEVQVWRWGDPIEPLRATVMQAKRFISHNISFDRPAWNLLMTPLGLPPLSIEQCDDTAARCRAIGLLSTLEGAAKILLPTEFHKANKAIVRKMSQPRRAWPGEDPNALHWVEDEESWAELISYGKQDVEVLRALDRVLPSLSPFERQVWIKDQIANDIGIYLDGAGIAQDCELIKDLKLAANARMNELTGGKIKTTDQHPAIRAWVNKLGAKLDNMEAASVRKELARDDLPLEARQILQLRLEAAQAAAAKPLRMRAWRNVDGRARQTLIYHAAAPGRWAGTGVQFQNVKKSGEKSADELDDGDDGQEGDPPCS
jgi:DNA polymerase